MNTNNDGARRAPLDNDAGPDAHQLGPHPLAGVDPADFPTARWTRERAARWYIGHGMQVFPVCAPKGADSCTGAGLDRHAGDHKRGKLPTKKWGGASRVAMTEREVIIAWRNHRHNIGLPCGRAGGSYTVGLDFDGPDGERNRADAEAVLGALPPTLTSETGRGRHLLYYAPADATPDDVASVKGSIASVRLDAARKLLVTAREGEGTSFDLRCEGGYIVAPGSTHANGKHYTATGVPIAPLPRAWWDALPRRGPGPGTKRATALPLPLAGEGEAFGRIAAAAVTSSRRVPGVRMPGDPPDEFAGLPDDDGDRPTRGAQLAEVTRARVSPPPLTSTRGNDRPAPTTEDRARAALNAALPKLCGEIESAPDGAQNNTINSNALRAFRLALAAAVDLDTVAGELLAACERGGHPEAAARATVASARAAAEHQGPAELRDRPRVDRRAPGARGRRAEDRAERATGDDPEGSAGQGEGGVPDDGRPRVIVGPDLHRVVADALDTLGAHRNVYQRRGVGLVHVLAAPPGGADPGAPIIDPLPRPVLAARLSEVAQWVGFDRKGEPRLVQPPESVVAAVHAWGEFPATVRPLRGIVEAPTMRRDGSIATAHGYDAPSGLFVHWPGAELSLPDRPTREDARDAFNELAGLFGDFRFAGDGPAQGIALSAVVAAMLSPLAREAVDGPCPAFVFEADGPGAGKTLAASVCGALVTGRVPAPRQYTADDDETEKRFGSIAIAGHPCVIIDNVRVHVEGGALERVLTAHDSIAFRLLGRSEDRELPWRTVVFLTMNSASFSEDVSHRVVQITMKSRAVDLDAPADRFTINDLVRHTIDNRPRLLRAAFTILRAHQLAGRPMPGATLPRYEAWSRVVAGAVCWASGHDPVRARPPESANRDANVARAVVLAWCAAYPNEAVTVGALRARLLGAPSPGAAGPARADAMTALRDALAELGGVADVSRVSAGTLGRRIQGRVKGHVYVDPATGRSVCVRPTTPLHGSARYIATVEAVTAPLPDDHPLGGMGECGSQGESGNSPKVETHTQRAASPAVESWDA